jgi:hypothetical protein
MALAFAAAASAATTAVCGVGEIRTRIPDDEWRAGKPIPPTLRCRIQGFGPKDRESLRGERLVRFQVPSRSSSRRLRTLSNQRA